MPTRIRLHALAINARGPLTVWLDGQEHRLEAGNPAVVHDLDTSPGRHELEVMGRVALGRTGHTAAAIDVPQQGIDVHYALPAAPWMRGEISDEPDTVPGTEWRITLGAVIALVGVVWLTWFGWVLFT